MQAHAALVAFVHCWSVVALESQIRHARHTLPSWYVPLGHRLHWAPVPTYPRLQVQVASATLVHTVWMAAFLSHPVQSEHVVPPALDWYTPKGQPVQTLAAVPPTTLEYVPAAHATQPADAYAVEYEPRAHAEQPGPPVVL